MISQIEWNDAKRTLNELICNCDSFSPEDIAEAAKASGFGVNFTPLKGWESLRDEDILNLVLDGTLIGNGRAVVITEASLFGKANPFAMNGSDFAQFIAWHLATLGECVFNGDVVILLLNQRKVCLFHHEGYNATIDC